MAGVTVATKFLTAPLGNVVLAACPEMVGEMPNVMPGEVTSAMFTPTAGAATELPLLSEAMATIEASPGVAGVLHGTDHVPEPRMTLPLRSVSFTNTCTPVIVPSASDTVPLIVVAVSAARNAFVVGVEMPMTGGTPVAPVTVTVTGLERLDSPVTSNTRASSFWGPS